ALADEVERAPDAAVEPRGFPTRICQVAPQQHFLEGVERQGLTLAAGAGIEPDKVAKTAGEPRRRFMAAQGQVQDAGRNLRPIEPGQPAGPRDEMRPKRFPVRRTL